MRTVIACLLLGFFGIAFSGESEDFDIAYNQFLESWENGKAKESLPFAAAAYDLSETVLANDDEGRAQIVYNYAENLIATGDKKAALPLLKEAGDLFTRKFGPYNDSLIGVHLLEAAALSGDGHVGPQLAKLKLALSITEKHFGKYSKEFAIVNFKSAKSLIDLGNNHKHALPFLNDAERLFKELEGKQSENLALALFYGGKATLMRKRRRTAASQMEKAVSIFDSLDSQSAEYWNITARAYLVNTYVSLREPDKATSHINEIRLLRPLPADQKYHPILRVAPIYPSSMLSIGKEGYVDFVFTVDEEGKTANIKVLSSTDSGFEYAARKAVQGFRYTPRYVNGIAVATLDVITRIRFELER